MKAAKAEPIVTRSSRTTKPTRVLDESPPRVRNARSSPSRSPGRKKLSPVSSPKSSGRRSPSRKSPARKSPSRKSPARKSPKSVKRPVGRPPKSKDVFDDIKPEEEYYKKEPKNVTNGVDLPSKIRSSLRERKPFSYEYEPYVMLRRSKNSDDSYEKILSLAQNTELPRGENSFDRSDNGDISEDDIPPFTTKFETRKLFTPLVEIKKPGLEFGGKFMVFLYVMLACMGFLIPNVCCSKQLCTFTSVPNLKKYSKLENIINLRSTIIVASFVALNVLSTLIPYFGKKTTLPDGKNTFVANSVFSSFGIILISSLIHHFYFPIFQIIYNDYIQLTMASLIFGILLSIAVYYKSSKVPISQRNIHANTGYFFYDFWMGREINPIFFKKFHIKIILFRLSLCGAILVNIAWIVQSTTIKLIPISYESLLDVDTYKNFTKGIDFNPTLILFAAMQINYLFDSLLFESTQPTTFEFMYEGVGHLMCVGYFSYPFGPSLITKYIIDHNINSNYWILITSFIVYVTGFYIYRKSNSEKAMFRANPLDPRVAHLDSIPTFHGKKLLVSGWWGFVRHPNYLGDLLMHTAMGVAVYNVIPIYYIVFTFVYLLHRMRRDGIRCSERYGTAWSRYCQRVPYYLIPKVF